VRRRGLSPALCSTTRASSAAPTRTAGRRAWAAAWAAASRCRRSPTAACRARGRAATTPAPPPGCPTPATPSSTPSPGQRRRASRRRPIWRRSRPPTTRQTADRWTAPASWPMTTTVTRPSTPATAWALLRP